MKLSFSLSSKPSSKQQSNPKPSKTFTAEPSIDPSPPNKQYVTEFDPSKTLSNSKSKTHHVIPPKPNEWRPHKKMKNLDLPVQSDAPGHLQFEVDPTSVEPSDPNISYGLNLRQSAKNDDAGADATSGGRPPEPIDSVMLQKLRDDLKRLPEDNGFDEFNDVPVEGFGKALLAGYGWYEGRGIGRNAMEDVKVVQYERRTTKEGLGFVGDLPKINSAKIDNRKKEKKERSNGGVGGKHYVGKYVRIVGGREMGLKGRIVEVIGGGDSLVLKLSRSEEEVTVRVRDVADLGSAEEEKCLQKLRDLNIRVSKEETSGSDVKRGKESSNGRDYRERRDEGSQDRNKDSKRGREDGRRGNRKEEEPMMSSRVAWLTSHIRVRIISKELGGRLYLKKGEVVDVVGPTSCDISMDDSRELIQGVDQDHLETVLPRRGGPVLILYGKRKGVYGNLVERDLENETGVVRDADTHELLNVRLEQIAEYSGDPSYIGY